MLMTLIDFNAVRRAFCFLPTRPALIGAGAALYGVVFAIQSLLFIYAGVHTPGMMSVAVGFGPVVFGVFIVVAAGFARAMLNKRKRGVLGLTLGGDEGRLAWVVVLILILIFTVPGTALVALSFMLTALALINVDAGAEPPEGLVNIFDLFGQGEMAVAIVLVAVFIIFSLWFFLRLALAAPATVHAGAIKVLSIWPLSSKHSFEIALTLTAALIPGFVILTGFNALCVTVLGAGPAIIWFASGGMGAPTLNPAVLLMMYVFYGAGKITFLAAPGLFVLSSLYMKYLFQNAPDSV